MTQIKKHINSLTAVLVVTNGTVPRVTVGTDYGLSMLSAIFPNAVTNNLAFLSTNVSSPLYLNYTLPGFLKDAPQFLLDNPIALQKKFREIKDGPDMKMRRSDVHKEIKAIEQNTLEMLVDFFDLLDSLEPQSIKAPQNIITKILALMKAAATKKAKGSAVSFHHWCSDICLVNDANSFSDFQKSIPAPASKQRPASNHDFLCTAPDCSTTCSPQPPLIYTWIKNMIPWLQFARRSKCAHPHLHHCHTGSQRDLEPIRRDAVTDPPWSVEDPADPLPSVSPSTRVAEAAQPPKEGNPDTEEKEICQNQLECMRNSSEQKADLLGKAKERLRQGIKKIKRIFSGRVSK